MFSIVKHGRASLLAISSGWLDNFFSPMIFRAKDVGIPKGISQLINIPLITPLNGNSVEYCGILWNIKHYNIPSVIPLTISIHYKLNHNINQY